MKILIVEDSENIRNLLVRQMGAYGHEVTATANGVEALQQALKERPDILVTDILMPKMDGYQLCYEWKQNDKLKDIPFIFYTATYISEEDEKFALSLGASTFIRKPAEPDTFAQILTEVLEKAKSGALAPPKVAPLKPSLYLTEYTKRLITKLDKTVAQLQESEEKYRTTFENTGTAMVVLEEDTTISLANHQFEILSGYSRQEIEGKKSWTEFVHQEDLEEMKEYHGKRREPGGTAPAHYEFRFVDKEGNIKDILLAVDVIPGTKKSIASLMDITERKQAEEALREGEKDHKLLFQSILDGLLVFDAETMKVVLANQAAAKLYGFDSAEEAIGVNPLDFVAPDDRERALRIIVEDMFQKDLRQVNEFRTTAKDGREVWVSAVGTRTAYQGRLAGLISLRDITERKQAEKALQESEENFRRSLEDSPLGVRIFDAEGETLYANQAILDIYGYAGIEELKADPAEKRLTPESYAEHLKRMEKRLRGGEITPRFEMSIVRKDGETRYLQVFRKEILWNGERQFQSLYYDITERKRAEEALRESEERIHLTVSNVPLVMWSIDKEGIYTLSEGAGLEARGFKPGDIVGQSIEDVFRDAPQVQGDNRRALAGETFVSIREVGDMIFESYYSPIRDKNQEVIGMVGVSIDITERKEAEEALRESEARYHVLVDLGAEVGEVFVMLQDTEQGEGMQTFVSDEWPRITGYSKKELLGMSFFDLVYSKDRQASLERHRRKISGESIPGLFEMSIIRKDGTAVPIELTSAHTTYMGKDAIVVYIRDITERKKMEEQLIVTDRLASIGELSSGIAHELNNPLTSVIGFSELLLGRDLPDDVKEDLEVVSREAKRTAGVVKNLLTFARKHETDKKPVDINSIIEKVLELRACEQKVNNIQVNTQFAPDLPEITVHGFDLQQVFINIIINAEHFMIEAHRRGTLTITTERVGDIIRATFADDGPGIAKENLGHLFDPFFTTKEVGKGTGLGLSICHGVVTEHGGRIYVESELGKGAAFVVELPISR